MAEKNPMFRHRTSSRRRRAIYRSRIIKMVIPVFILIVLIVAICLLLNHRHNKNIKDSEVDSSNDSVAEDVLNPVTTPPPLTEPPAVSITPPVEEEPEFIHKTDQTVGLGDEFPSEFAILINAQTGEILAEKNAFSFMNPASMTKVLTLLVAVENITDTDGTFTMTREISEYCYVNECSVVGYIVDETVPIDELFYGCILSSGADACLGLAEIAVGSHEAFVDLMNEKLEELGLTETAHVTNCVGLYDEAHGWTSADMALIMKAALENEKCRQILCTKIFDSVPTEKHPEGQFLSNWFVRSLEDQDNGDVNVLGGKRGYVPESGNCAVSYGETEDGQAFICVTGNAYSQKQAILDHAALYKEYCHS